METTDVFVTNMTDYTTELSNILARLDSTLTKFDNIALQVEDIQVYMRVLVNFLAICGACYIANWLWKTWIRGLVRTYFKLPI